MGALISLICDKCKLYQKEEFWNQGIIPKVIHLLVEVFHQCNQDPTAQQIFMCETDDERGQFVSDSALLESSKVSNAVVNAVIIRRLVQFIGLVECSEEQRQQGSSVTNLPLCSIYELQGNECAEHLKSILLSILTITTTDFYAPLVQLLDIIEREAPEPDIQDCIDN